MECCSVLLQTVQFIKPPLKEEINSFIRPSITHATKEQHRAPYTPSFQSLLLLRHTIKKQPNAFRHPLTRDSIETELYGYEITWGTPAMFREQECHFTESYEGM